MTRVVVVGDALLDRDVLGDVERLCPDAPVPVVDVTDVRQRPGGAALAALLLADDGTEVVLAAGVGDDEAGRRLRGDLLGRVTVHVVLRPATTPAKTRVRSRGQSLLRLDDSGHLLGGAARADGRLDEPVEEPVDTGSLSGLLLGADAVLVADYGGPVTRHPDVRACLADAARHVPVVWDPHPRGLPPVPGVRVATPNAAEARAVAPADEDWAVHDRPSGAAGLARALLRVWPAGTVVVTDGPRGAVAAGPDGVVHAVPDHVVADGADTCGAGDRFAGRVALGLARGQDVTAAVGQAVDDVAAWLADGGVATAHGAAGDRPIPDRPTADRPTADRPTADRPTADLPTADLPGTATADLAGLLARVRAAGGTVVATGGCFDVLHVGHLALLEEAAAMGTCLVVLLNSDRGVRGLKGPDRPVQPEQDRALLLAALACVDAVVVFDEDTPTEALARLRPDVWVKGGDYRPADLPEAPTVLAHGGRVAVVPYLAGRSTTAILTRPSSHGQTTTGAPT